MQEGCAHNGECVRFQRVCIPSVATPHICQRVLVRVAVSSIHICASPRRLNICHRAKSTSKCKGQKVFCVCTCVGFLDTK